MAKARKASAHDAETKPRAPKKRAAAKSKSKSKTGQSKSVKSDASKYTNPALRDRLKAKILAGEKGGKAGQWSARKAQLLAAEYKKAGGGYTRPKSQGSEAQKHLDKWTEEKWTTDDGKPAIREGETARYLPENAWDNLTPSQKKATKTKKTKGSQTGKQYVANTAAAKSARKSASKPKAKAKPRAARKKPASSS